MDGMVAVWSSSDMTLRVECVARSSGSSDSNACDDTIAYTIHHIFSQRALQHNLRGITRQREPIPPRACTKKALADVTSRKNARVVRLLSPSSRWALTVLVLHGNFPSITQGLEICQETGAL